MKKIYLSILILLLSSQISYCAETSDQTLSSTLGDVLEISKVIVENVEHDRDMPLPEVKKKTNTPSGEGVNVITLSPMQVKIHTNLSTPINVTAEFQELKHTSNLYDFSSSDLSFSPNNITINNPYNNVVTDDFVPQMNVRTGVATGLYEGKVRFTLGAI